MIKAKKILYGLFIFFFFIIVAFIFYIFLYPNTLYSRELEKKIIIPYSCKSDELGKFLYDNQVIKGRSSFELCFKLMQKRRKHIPGLYRFTSKMSNWDILNMITRGLQYPTNVTFDSNIIDKETLASRITANLYMGAEQFLELLNSPEFLKSYGFNTDNILAMFIPNTYEVYWNIKPEMLFKRLYQEYKLFWNNEMLKKASLLKLTPIEVYILASIVKAETNFVKEMPVIAGVYINRLRLGRPLQGDPTIRYANKNFNCKRVLKKDLEIDSPYNTYKRKGLPIGPIGIASVESIEAVLNYQQHSYLYFSVNIDPLFPNTHTFSKTFEEHKLKAILYRKKLNKLSLYR
jgi:UPF0755 protein